MYNIKLLLIDDDEDDFLLTRDLLDEISRGPYSIDWASSYEQGMEMLQENRHDLCLMDYRLGSHDGIELLRQAQSLGFSGPIILLTGTHNGEVDIQALEAGAVDYLVKNGLTSEQLARSIRYALGRREMELERVERLRAEADNRSKSEFLAHLSHELRTPMSAILGFTELLMNSATDDESKGYLRVVHRNGKHLLGLLNDILDLSKIEAGKLELEQQSLNLPSFITDVYFLMYGAAADKDLFLRMEAPKRLPLKVTTDPTRLRQILLNLMGNAIKFTDSGEVVLAVKLEWLDGRQVVQFSVRDTGVGIDPEAQENVFLPFVQARSTAESRAGTGLGLAISRQLARRLGGDIQLKSTPGVGSEFRFTLDPGDLTEVELVPFELSFDAAQEPTSETPQFTGRVLVVDDLRDIRVLIGHFIAVTGVEVKYAKDGEEALRMIEDADGVREPIFDVVLMDIHMPVMGGHETAKRLREQGFTQPLIALTAANMKGDMDACLAAGFTAYLSKPVDQHQVHACLARYLDSSSNKQPPNPSNRTILVVEDDTDAGDALSGLLELLDYRVVAVRSGAEAMECIQRVQPALVLMDLHLPDMDGYQLAEQLQVLASGYPIVIISGAEVDSARAKAAGVRKSLLKPVDLAQLKQALQLL